MEEFESNTKGKKLFTAVFERYECGKGVFERKTHFRDVRLRTGGLVADRLVFDEGDNGKIQGHLTLGEYVAFLADVEFKNIEFQYPHSL